MNQVMKKIIYILMVCALTLALTLPGISGEAFASTTTSDAYDSISDNMKSQNGKYQIAMMCDSDILRDGAYNEAIWNGCKMFARDNGLSYKYYCQGGGYMATDDDRIRTMKEACQNGAEAVVVNGFLFGEALERVAPLYPTVQFIFVDGWDLGLDNVVGVCYEEAEAGFLAGYAAVKEGFTRLGFSGAGGGTNPACAKYGYGFAQGANAAAKELGKKVEMRYSWEYGSIFSASPELENMLASWYKKGTEAIFVCGGSMVDSAVAAAEKNNGFVIGCDIDQSQMSKAVISSAMKNYSGSVIEVLNKFYKANKMQSGSIIFGAEGNGVCLPTETWRLKNWSVKEYKTFFSKVQKGDFKVKNNSYSNPENFGLNNVTFIDVPAKSDMPQNLKVKKVTPSKLNVSWDKVEGATKYMVYRSKTGKEGSFKKIKTTSKTSCTDTGLTSGKTYYYRVKAVTTDGTSNASDTKKCRVPYKLKLSIDIRNKPGVATGLIKIAITNKGTGTFKVKQEIESIGGRDFIETSNYYPYSKAIYSNATLINGNHYAITSLDVKKGKTRIALFALDSSRIPQKDQSIIFQATYDGVDYFIIAHGDGSIFYNYHNSDTIYQLK